MATIPFPEGIKEPFAGLLRALLHAVATTSYCPVVEGSMVIAGEVCEFGPHELHLMVAPFVPGRGFVLDSSDCRHCKISIPDLASRSVALCIGAMVVCSGKMVQVSEHEFRASGHQVGITPRPELQVEMAWSAYHLFAGAFGGWEMATKWLSEQNTPVLFGQHTSIDADEGVIEIWEQLHGTKAVKAPLPYDQDWIASTHVGIHAAVGDPTIVALCQAQVNSMGTMSPPCQPWSKGGKRLGLSCDNGWAFVSGLILAFKLQVIILTAECADEIVSHEHYEMIMHIAKHLGFKLIWSQVTPLNHLSPQMRTRWLATWVRADVSARFYDAKITPSTMPRQRWHDMEFDFHIPQVWKEQLLLSDSEKEFYGDPQFLPSAKKHAFGQSTPTCDQVLWARYPKESEPLPTLCASYTTQHLLDRRHVEAKGVFAFLQLLPEGIAFFDPARFVSLLGATEDRILPTKVHEAFKYLGNAIATPHALLPVILGFLAVLPEGLSIHELVQKCWHDRLSATNAIVCQVGSFVHVIRITAAPSLLQKIHGPPQGPFQIELKFLGDHPPLEVTAQGSQSLGQVFCTALAGPRDVIHAFMLVGASQTMDLSCTVAEVFSIQTVWTLTIQGTPVGEIEIAGGDLSDPFPPTLEWEPQAADQTAKTSVVAQADFDSTMETLVDLGIWQIIEQGFDVEGGQMWNFLLTIPDLGVTFACSMLPQQRALLCAAIQSLSTVSTDYCGQAGYPQDVLLLSLTPVSTHRASSHATVFIQPKGSASLWACKLELPADATHTFLLDGTVQSIFRVEGIPNFPNQSKLQHGFLLHTQPMPTIKAGGHHLADGRAPSLPADATFNQRAEFATNTHGWMAADEMVFATQLLQWATPGSPHFSPPAYWDITQSDFDESPFGPLTIQPAGATYIPILAGDHWCGIEITKDDQHTQVVTVQVPPHLHARIIMIVARALDIGPHRMQILHHDTQWTQHMCGWELLHRWAHHQDQHDTLAAAPTHNPMTADQRDVIDIVLQAAVEDWGTTGTTSSVAQLAFWVRRSFFMSVLRRTTNNGRIANQRPLETSHPIGYRPPQHVVHPQIASGDQIQHRVNTRLLHIHLNPVWMHFDEIDFILEGPRSLLPEVLFCPPATWDSSMDTLVFLDAPNPVYDPYGHIIWLIEDSNHWIQAECYKSGHQAFFYLTAPQASNERLSPLVQQLRAEFGYNQGNFTVHAIQQHHPPGMCGQQLIHALYMRLGIDLPTLSVAQHLELRTGPHSAPILHITQTVVARWHAAGAHPVLRDFALHARHWFLLRVTRNHFPDTYIAAGTQDPVPMDTAGTASAHAKSKATPPTGKVDILTINDPWLHKSAKPTQSKWEDLSFQEPIPFVGGDGKPLQQVHRLQVSQSRAGVVLATKTHVGDLIKAAGTLDLAIIIPTVDGTKPPGLFQEFTGPHEITLDDPLSKTTYKRLAMLHVAAGKITYQLAAPKLKMTTAAIAEIVLEADSRLMSKQDFDKTAEQPLNTLRQHMHQLVPSHAANLTYYGLRTNKHPGAPKGEQQIQCIVKAPLAARQQILELSGQTFLLTRDFIDHHQLPQDTTVLPRFWNPTQQDLADMRIITKGVEGAAGIIATRRGLALRVWVKHIAAARLALLLLPSDQRLTADNRHVVPRVTIQASGWPPGTDPPNVVQSTLAATGVAMVPTRTFRAAGVHVWILTAESVPATTRFTIDADGKVHEILLQPFQSQPPSSKGAGKGKSKANKKAHQRPDDERAPWPSSTIITQPKTHLEEERISRLESRFDQLEQRQAGFESRVENKFDHISDSLRQILAASHQRTREATGETPPSKLHKQS